MEIKGIPIYVINTVKSLYLDTILIDSKLYTRRKVKTNKGVQDART